MELIEIKEKKILNNFLVSQKHSQFLQSWEWGEFQAVEAEQCSARTKRYGIEENGKLIAVATLIKKNLGLGKSYWFCPRGPIINYQLSIKNYEAIIDFLTQELLKQAKKEGIIFLRFEPQHLTPSSPLLIRRGAGGEVKRTLDIQPSKTVILNLEKSEEEILKNMHQKTRYNIRLAEKKGIEIEISPKDNPLDPSPHPDPLLRKERGNARGGDENFEEWWSIMEQTKDRDGFRLHGKEYYRKMLNGQITNYNHAYRQAGLQITNKSQIQNLKLKINNSKLDIKLILAKHKNKIIAGNIVAFFGDTATYVHGASSNEYRNLMAPYLLQWETIQIAKRLGYKYYDFYGVDEKKWPGVTRFKKGFSNNEINYPGTFDAVFDSKWYWAYNVVRKIRRML